MTDTSPNGRNDTEQAVRTILEKVRPFIQAHGGDVRLLRIDESIAVLTVDGACVGCPLAELTYNGVIKKLILEDVPGITAVVLE
jgi:Fe-S cluster biogenesis protein NfuA